MKKLYKKVVPTLMLGVILVTPLTVNAATILNDSAAEQLPASYARSQSPVDPNAREIQKGQKTSMNIAQTYTTSFNSDSSHDAYAEVVNLDAEDSKYHLVLNSKNSSGSASGSLDYATCDTTSWVTYNKHYYCGGKNIVPTSGIHMQSNIKLTAKTDNDKSNYGAIY